MNGPVTTYHDPSDDGWSWSYSKLKNYETCPKRHFHYDVSKDVKEPESDQLKDGFFVHDVLAKRIGKGEPLPPQVSEHEHWAEKVLTGPGTVLVEQKLAINKQFGPSRWFGDRTTWYRGIADVIKINGRVALIIDWKTGKIVEDAQQLFLMTACVFAHHPEVMAARTEFAWLAHNATTRQDFRREDMPGHWANLMPRINQLKEASKTMTYPPKPGYLCKRWCAVTSCPHNGV